MKNIEYRLGFTFLILFMFGCKNKDKNNSIDKNTNIATISVDLEKAKTYDVSQIYETIEWTSLQSDSEESILGEILKLEIHNDRYYIHSNNSIFIFSKKGEFIKKMNFSGNGPGEYIVLSDFFIDEISNTILIYDSKSKKINIYNEEGEFVNEIETGLDAYSFTKLNNGNFAVYIGSGYYNENTNCRLNILDPNGNILKKFIPIKDNEAKFLHLGDLTNFQAFQKEISFLYSFNDTIYNISDNRLKPKYYVDFGNSKVPEDYLERTYSDIRDFLETLKKTDYGFRSIGFFETTNTIASSFMHRNDIIHYYYSKKTGKTKVVNEYRSENLFPLSSYPSNYSNLPKASFNDKLYSLIDSHKLIERVENVKSNLSTNEWTDYVKKNSALMTIYKKLNITDNPILMIGELKKF